MSTFPRFASLPSDQGPLQGPGCFVRRIIRGHQESVLWAGEEVPSGYEYKDPKAKEKFADAQSAYELLSDAKKKETWDQYGAVQRSTQAAALTQALAVDREAIPSRVEIHLGLGAPQEATQEGLARISTLTICSLLLAAQEVHEEDGGVRIRFKRRSWLERTSKCRHRYRSWTLRRA